MARNTAGFTRKTGAEDAVHGQGGLFEIGFEEGEPIPVPQFPDGAFRQGELFQVGGGVTLQFVPAGEKKTAGEERVVPGDREITRDTSDTGTEKTVKKEEVPVKKKTQPVKKKPAVKKKAPVKKEEEPKRKEESRDEDDADLVSGLLFLPEDTILVATF